ncbi:flagellar hook-associated protein FlgK [Neomoorella mulderi]|uniref:Flagellar hook-associated protein 1 n=1 Tax=Moorella mulderi DSM 14980 TaxID=1122241 RepID=A0A151AZ59_9FIRM|nr:flagellar hook-associated protein FlgK [Moorella mulderi]KYH32697.1 flagellar hook-associated protein 1 [Moorella mulderi DSM 14980]
MPGTFFGFNTALRGMQAQQRGIYTTAHNIANANTEGYTRQRVVLATLPAYPVPSMNHPGGTGWQIGTGVDSQETRRLRDEFLDTQIRRETGSLGQWEQIQDVLKQVEIVFNEPSDTGLSTLMSQFWAAWQELSKYAESSPVRTTVVETASALAEAFNHSAQQLETIIADIDQTIELKVTEINSIAQQIADLNGQIKNIVAAGDQPNDLMDQRDLLLDRLSKIVRINVQANSDGTINVTIEGAPSGDSTLKGQLVDGTTSNDLFIAKDVDVDSNQVYVGIIKNYGLLDPSNPIVKLSSRLNSNSYSITYNDSDKSILLSDGSNTYSSTVTNTEVPIQDLAVIKLNDPLPSPTTEPVKFDTLDISAYKQNPDVNGEIKGLLLARDNVKEYLDKLNILAKGLAENINKLHKEGYNLSGQKVDSNYENFFVALDPSNPQNFISAANITAGNIAVNPNIRNDVSQIAAAYPDPPDDTSSIAPGNGYNALRIAQLQQKLYVENNGTLQESTSGGVTIDDYYKNFTAKLGVDAHEASRMTTNQGVLVDQLTNRRESISGVSLDEEMANMLQYQRAYEASARMITTLDAMLDKIINGMGVTR